MYDDFFRKTDGIESLVFLLTEMNDGNVKAELINSPGDVRLLNPAKAFALIQVDHFRLSEDALQFLGDVDPYVDGVGQCLMLKPHVYNRLTRNGNHHDFFAVLSSKSEDVILTDKLDDVDDCRFDDDDKDLTSRWRVVPSTQKIVTG